MRVIIYLPVDYNPKRASLRLEPVVVDRGVGNVEKNFAVNTLTLAQDEKLQMREKTIIKSVVYKKKDFNNQNTVLVDIILIVKNDLYNIYECSMVFSSGFDAFSRLRAIARSSVENISPFPSLDLEDIFALASFASLLLA